MGKILVVAEKPAAGADMAKVVGATEKKKGYYEGSGYIVTWAVGHLVGLKYPEEHNPDFKKWDLAPLPFDFPIKGSLKILPSTSSQFAIIKSLIQRPDVDMIINAGDAGREGYLIQEWIYRMAGNRKPKKVLWASSLTEEALRKAFADLKDPDDFDLLLEEAEARAMGDYAMGINYSRALTLTVGNGRTLLKYGRCQTPLLNEIVMRDREIEGFTSKPYYNIALTYRKGFTGMLYNMDKKAVSNLADKAKADGIVEKLTADGGPARVVSYACTDKSQSAPQLYNLAELQKVMGSRYGMSADETLATAQSLYEKHKILSYPRTDSRALSMDVFHEVKDHIATCRFGDYKNTADSVMGMELFADKKYFNDLKVTDHHALIPTVRDDFTDKDFAALTEKEQRVLDAVIRSFLAAFLPPYEYQVTEVIAEKAGYSFYSRGKTIKSLGYRSILKDLEKDKKKDAEDMQILPVLEEGAELTVDDVKRLDKKTKPPAKYSVGSIVSLMEKRGIGTSATRAEIIKKLMDPKAQYITLDKGKYSATELGKEYIDILPEALKDVNLTQKFEARLKEISDGKITKEDFLAEMCADEKEMIESLKKASASVQISAPIKGDTGLACPVCGRPILESQKSFYCTGYKDGCKFSIWKEIGSTGKKVTPAMAEQLITKGKTSKIKGFKKKNGDGTFDAKLVLKDSMDGKYAFEFDDKKK